MSSEKLCGPQKVLHLKNQGKTRLQQQQQRKKTYKNIRRGKQRLLASEKALRIMTLYIDESDGVRVMYSRVLQQTGRNLNNTPMQFFTVSSQVSLAESNFDGVN